MIKKILIIGICLLVGIGGCVFVISKIPYGAIIFIGTGLPTYVGNTILPAPNIAKKTNEEKKEMLIKLLTEIQQSLYNYQVGKASELYLKIARMGTPVVPVLIELMRDEGMDKRPENRVIYAGQVMEGISVIRNGAMEILKGIIEAKIVPLEERLQEIEVTDLLVHTARRNTKRYYNYAQRIEIDMDKMTSEMIDLLLSDEDSQTKRYASQILGAIGDRRGIEPIIKVATEERLGTVGTVYEGGVELLKKTRDRRLAKVLDQNGADYRVWVWADRDKAVRIAIDVLRHNYNPGLPFREKELLGSREREKETEERIKRYAIRVLSNANAKEASWVLFEMLKEEEKEYKYYWDIIEALQKMGEEETMTRAIDYYVEVIKREPTNTKVIDLIGDLSRDGGKGNSAVPILLELLEKVKQEYLTHKTNGETLGYIIDTLGSTKDKRAVEPLIELLKERDEFSDELMIGDIIRALGKIGDKKAVESLEDALNEPDIKKGWKNEIVRALKEVVWEKYRKKYKKGTK